MSEPTYQTVFAPPDGKAEHIAYGLLGRSEWEGNREFHVRDPWPLREEDYTIRTPAHVRTSGEVTWCLWNAARYYAGLLVVHTHLGPAVWSAVDEADSRRWLHSLFDFTDFFVRAVIGSDGVVVEARGRDEDAFHTVERMRVIGPRSLRYIYPKNSAGCPERLPSLDRATQDRTLRLGGGIEQALATIRHTSFGLIGVGGGNAAVLDLLKFLQPGEIVMVEFDTIEGTNANRYFGYRQGDIGQHKVDVQARELEAYDPSIKVRVVREPFPSSASTEALKGCDVLICFPDNQWTRWEAATFAARHDKALFEAGNGIYVDDHAQPQRLSAHVRTQLPWPLGPCLRDLGVAGEVGPCYEAARERARASYVIGHPEITTPPSVVTLNHAAANLLVRQILHWLCPGLSGTLASYLLYDEGVPTIRDLSAAFPRDPDCPLCGDGLNSVRGWGDHLPESLRVMAPPRRHDGSCCVQGAEAHGGEDAA